MWEMYSPNHHPNIFHVQCYSRSRFYSLCYSRRDSYYSVRFVMVVVEAVVLTVMAAASVVRFHRSYLFSHNHPESYHRVVVPHVSQHDSSGPYSPMPDPLHRVYKMIGYMPQQYHLSNEIDPHTQMHLDCIQWVGRFDDRLDRLVIVHEY